MEAISLTLTRQWLITAANVQEVRWKNERVARDERKHDSRIKGPTSTGIGQPVTSEVKSIAPEADLILVSGVEALWDVIKSTKMIK